MVNYHELNIQDLAINMIDGDINAKNQIINHYSDYIDNTIDKIFKDTEYDKSLIREILLQRLHNYLNNYKNLNDNYFSHMIGSYIVSATKSELKKIQSREELKTREMHVLSTKMINGDNDALKKIIEFYTLRIKKLLRDNYSHINYEEEDLVQVGIIGLLKAINLYALGKETHFSILANSYIRREIERELNISNKSINIEYIGLIKNNNFKSFDDFIENEEIKEAINKLSIIKKKILFLYTYGKCTFTDIGEMFGFSHQRAQQHYNQAIELIKQELDLPIEKQKKL